MKATAKTALIDLVGVLLRANAEGALWLALSNEGITDAYMQSVSEAIKTLGQSGIAEIERRYEVKVPADLLVEITQSAPLSLQENQIAEFMLQRIENGHLALEDIPVRLTRYGLMDPGEFVEEVRERMDTARGEGRDDR